MGYASYYEDSIDARGESKSSKSRTLKVPNRREPSKKQYVRAAKTRHVPEDDICFESLLNNLPEPSRPTSKDDIDARGKSKQPKTLRPKPSPKPRQRIHRSEPRRKQSVSVAKTRYITPEEIQRRIELEIIRQDKESKGIYPH